MKKILLLSLLLLAACTNNKQLEKAYQITADNSENATLESLSNMAAKYDLIALQATPQNLMSGFISLQVKDDKLFVLDKMSKSLFVFDSNGTFLSKVGAQGRAFNEYLSIKTFFIDQNILYLFDDAGMFIYKYDADNYNFIEKLKMASDLKFINSVHRIDKDNLLVLYNVSFSENKDIYCIYTNDFMPKASVAKTDFTFQGEVEIGMSPVCAKDELFFLCPCENKIFTLSSDLKPIPIYELSLLGDVVAPQEKDFLQAQNTVKQSGASLINSIFCAGDYFVVNFGQGVLVINTKTNQCFNHKMGGVNYGQISYFPINPFKISCSDGQYFYSVLDAENVKMIIDKVSQNTTLPQSILTMSKELDSESNPVIMKFRY